MLFGVTPYISLVRFNWGALLAPFTYKRTGRRQFSERPCTTNPLRLVWIVKGAFFIHTPKIKSDLWPKLFING